MSSQSETLVRRQRPTSQFVSVDGLAPGSSNGGGSATRSVEQNQNRAQQRQQSSGTIAMPQAGYGGGGTYSNSDINRASSIYPPTISPPDSPRPSDFGNGSEPNISPISTAPPNNPWSRPSAIPAPVGKKRIENEFPAMRSASPAPGTEAKSGWGDVVRSMRRTPSPRPQHQESQQAQTTKGEGEPTKWDTYSGEKSLDGKGKTGAVSPAEHPYVGADQGFGYSAQITGGSQKPSHFLGVKLRKASERGSPVQRSQEPWRSASGLRGPAGRAAVVDPVADQPASTDKKHFPTPAERRAKGLFNKRAESGRTSPGPAVGLGIVRSSTPTGRSTPGLDERERERQPSALRIVTGALESVREAASNALQQRDKGVDARPGTSAPDGPTGQVVVSQPLRYRYRLGSGGSSSSRDQSPMTPTGTGPSARKPYPNMGLTKTPSADMLRGAYIEHAGGRSFTEPLGFTESPTTYAAVPSNGVYLPPPRKDSRFQPGTSNSADDSFDADQIASAFQALGLANVPKSHFSATTYNTSVGSVGDTSPPGSPPLTIPPGVDSVPPLPSVPAQITAQAQQESVLNRKRPVPSAANQFRVKPPTRKPTPKDGEIGTGSGDDGASGSPGATPAVELLEPPKPIDRVTALEDKLAVLNRRKASLAAVIHELTNVVQPSSIAYDMASRTEIRKTVEQLKGEQNAVLAEIQELGIKLHRAYRKRDEEQGGGGGTGLWVRRVTE